LYAVTLNELKAVLKVSAQEGQSGAVNKSSVESTAQDDDFHEVTRPQSYKSISNNTSQTTKKSTKQIPTSAAVEMPPQAVSTREFFASLRATTVDTETIEVEETLPEQEAPKTR
jgi:hypothetical protein